MDYTCEVDLQPVSQAHNRCRLRCLIGRAGRSSVGAHSSIGILRHSEGLFDLEELDILPGRGCMLKYRWYLGRTEDNPLQQTCISDQHRLKESRERTYALM